MWPLKLIVSAVRSMRRQSWGERRWTFMRESSAAVGRYVSAFLVWKKGEYKLRIHLYFGLCMTRWGKKSQLFIVCVNKSCKVTKKNKPKQLQEDHAVNTERRQSSAFTTKQDIAENSGGSVPEGQSCWKWFGHLSCCYRRDSLVWILAYFVDKDVHRSCAQKVRSAQKRIRLPCPPLIIKGYCIRFSISCLLGL